MKFGGLLTAVLLLAALGGAVYWSNHKHAADALKTPPDTTIRLVNVPEDQVREVRLIHANTPPVVLARDGKTWRITQPENLAADQDTVSGLLAAITTLSADSLVEEKAANLHSFGLDAPALQVELDLKNGKTDTVRFGADAPANTGEYVSLADAKVYIVPSSTRSSLDKTVADLRDKRLLTFDPEKLARIRLVAGATAPIEFGKNAQGDWQILQPKPLRADGGQVDELVRKLKEARLTAPAKAAGVKVATAQVTDASGTQTLEVRKDAAGKFYATSSVVSGVYSIADDLGLSKKLDDFRNKKVFDFGFSDPVKIETGTFTVEKKGEKWISNGKEKNAGAVQSLIDKLRDLSATAFLPKATGTPVMTLSVTTGKRVENVAIQSTSATRDSEVYQLDPKNVTDIQNAVAAVQR